MATTWVNLLRKNGVDTPARSSAARQTSRAGLGRGVTVSERTPQARVGAKKSTTRSKAESSSVQVLRSQIANLLREKRQLADKVEEEHASLVKTKSELKQTKSQLEAVKMNRWQLVGHSSGHASSPSPQPSCLHNHFDTSSEEVQAQVCGLRDALDQTTREKRVILGELERERERGREEGRRARTMEEQLSQSSITNSELEKSLREREEQVEGLVAHVTDLRSEISLLRDHVTSHHTHNNNILVKDLERLCLRNAELSDALAATRHSRTLLEREMVSLKRSLLEARSRQSQLEGSLREVEREREELAERVASSEGEGRRRLREMQRQLDSVLADSGRLEGTLSSLGSEKELLATSLRQEANYNKQLEEEKEALEAHLHETSQRLEASQAELQRLQNSQVSEINAKCREIDRMKSQLQQELGGLVGEKEALTSELRESKEHLGRLVGEKDALTSELRESKEHLGRLVGEKDALTQELQEMREELGRVAGEKGTLTQELQETREELGRVVGEKDALAWELRETREQLGRTRAENERLSSECGSLHESLAGVEGRKRELEVETGRLKREVEEERKRCEHVEREGRDAAETANNRAKQQVDHLSSQVKLSAQQLQQVVEENRTLQERLARVEGQLSQERSEYCAATDRLQGSLQRVMSELDSTLTELEDTRTNNMLFKQQVSDLEGQVSGLREQLDGRGELLQEMKALLEQRTSRIRQLERERRDSGDVLNLSHNTQDSSFVDTASLPSLDHPSPSPSLLTPPYHSASKLTASPVRFSSPTAESFHLKQRLADSRHACVQLEVQQASLKTDVAKLQGSLQALTTIREHLTEENNVLREANKGLEERCVVCVREKEEAESSLAAATEALESLGVEVDELRQEVDELRQEVDELRQEKEEQQEEMQAAVDELEDLCNEKDKELSELQLASQVMREEEGVVQQELVHLRREVEEWRKKAMKLEQTVDTEASRLREETARCTQAVSTLRAEAIEVKESNRITEAVNVTQSGQIQEREARVSSLLGEVEVLRARKAVVLRFLGEREGGEREVWRRERERMEVEIRKLQGEVRELTRGLQQCRGEGSGGGGCEGEVQAALEEALREKDLLKQQLARFETTPPLSELPPAPPVRMETVRVERLRRKLKAQVHQTNYLRMRLGYTLSELRLYKQAKQELDTQLGELQRGLRSSQQQYSQCLLQLQQAERLGFAGH